MFCAPDQPQTNGPHMWLASANGSNDFALRAAQRHMYRRPNIGTGRKHNATPCIENPVYVTEVWGQVGGAGAEAWHPRREQTAHRPGRSPSLDPGASNTCTETNTTSIKQNDDREISSGVISAYIMATTMF